MNHHQQILATIFGRFSWEARETVKNGVVLPHANSFALQFQRDMKECYRMVEDFYSVASDLQHRYVKLFENEENNKDVVEQVLLVDFLASGHSNLQRGYHPQVHQVHQDFQEQLSHHHYHHQILKVTDAQCWIGMGGVATHYGEQSTS